jgi:hypothetical protein
MLDNLKNDLELQAFKMFIGSGVSYRVEESLKVPPQLADGPGNGTTFCFITGRSDQCGNHHLCHLLGGFCILGPTHAVMLIAYFY